MQGFNMGRYHSPSSLDPSLTSEKPGEVRKYSRPGTRQPAVQVVRFEMPFAIWCSTCPATSSTALIGQGVRFNAEKRRVGAYYSTPIWAFRMKHPACGGWIEIRTDPQNTEYVVTEGAQRRDTGDDVTVAEREGAILIGGAKEKAEQEKKRQDAFAALEGKTIDQRRFRDENARIDELRSLRERDWKNVDERNKKLRAAFRVGRKEREKDGARIDALKERMGLGLEILAESEDDRRRAKLVEFGQEQLEDPDGLTRDVTKAATKPLFDKPLQGSSEKEKTGKHALQKELSSNSRSAINPFDPTVDVEDRNVKAMIPGLKLKRKRRHDPSPTRKLDTPEPSTDSPETEADTRKEKEEEEEEVQKPFQMLGAGLVSYSSESD